MDQQHDREAFRKRAREIYEHLELSAAEWATPEQYREHLARVDADLVARPIDARTLEFLLALEREHATSAYRSALSSVEEFENPDATPQARGGKGGNANGEKYEPLRVAALELALAGVYPSARAAAVAIQDEILARARHLEIDMSEFNAVKTISKWLRDRGYDLVN
ncbi:hypothetical protein [Burkholderia cenocepacia]|uniref:hypothetical protein n=1 Tax=Burkholderia cenocepacia TaxID=95486 RepID=UPI000D00F4D2|nr:hypothetical protein [Burkholderia cenocepacia]PRE35806.1 hypothetical protein C6P63_15625 [Burkholderia cenocepacia]